MKKFKYIMYLFAALFALAACQDKPDVYKFPVDKYYYDIPDVPVTENYVVGAFYNSITANYWTDSKTGDSILYSGKPVLGQYDVRLHPELIRQQLDYADRAGIDFFIITWSGHSSDTLFWNYEKYYDPSKGDPKVIVRLDPGYQFGTAKDTMQLNPLRMDTLLKNIDSLYTNLMNKDFYYKDNSNKPVMIFTNFTSTGDITSASSLVKTIRTHESNNLWIIGELGGGWSSPEYWGYQQTDRADTTKIFDGLFNTDMSTSNYDRWYGYYSFMDVNFKYWQDRMKTQNVEYIPDIEPSFNNTLNDPTSNIFIFDRSKKVYQTLANVAKRNIGSHRIIFINSWNNYDNGTNLEPIQSDSLSTKDNYLDYTKAFFKK